VKYILTTDDAIERFAGRAGGKATNLALAARHRVSVPAWFCVTAEAFDQFVEEHDIGSVLRPGDNAQRLDEFATEIETLFARLPLPADVEAEIDGQLDRGELRGQLLAVRSSGLDEDSAEHSFAGQFSSFLSQRGRAAVASAIRRCWASAFSRRAIAYRLEKGLGLARIRMGVVVQLMIEPVAAGVAFSRNPVHVLDREHVVVESVFGLGEGLVNGELDCDHFELDRDSLGVVRSELLAAAGGTRPSVSDAQLRDIGATALLLEESFGTPQDVEWAIDAAGNLHIVQTRPITTLPGDAFFDRHVNGNKATLWDNSNIIESYSGVTSPLTFSFANAAYSKVYRQFCDVMGVPKKIIDEHDAMFRNMLGLIRGRVYYNLMNWYRLVGLLPLAGGSGRSMEIMMGVRQQLKPEIASLFDFMQRPPRYSLPTKARVVLLGAWRFARLDSIVAAFQRWFDEIYENACDRDFNAMSLPELAEYYQYLDENVLAQWRAPIINDYFCMIFFGLLKRLTSEWVADGPDGESLQNDLLCGEGGLASAEPTKLLMRIAEWVGQQGPELAAWLQTTTADEAWRQMREAGRWPGLARRIEDYLDRYGFRCVDELKLEANDLHDDPSFVLAAIAGYIRAGKFDIGELETREAAIRAAAERTIHERLGGVRRRVYLQVLKQARKAIRNREDLRFARTKIFGIARRVFRAVGGHLRELGVLRDERDVFLLTVDDLLGFIEGRPTTVDLAGLVEIRRGEFDGYRSSPPPPDRLVTYGAAGVSIAVPQALDSANLLAGEAGGSDSPDVLTGTPCSPGIVEGIVRVATSSKEAEGVDREILVTERTDPGWVPLYPSCAGLLIERGSLLSHSAVVARELGLPTIVGITGGLMSRLKTGQRIRMDAGRGVVTILS